MDSLAAHGDLLAHDVVVSTVPISSVPETDPEPVHSQYVIDVWHSKDSSRCSVGTYEVGHRKFDCGSTC